MSHDAIKRYLESEKITVRLVWENVKGQVITSTQGYWAFDDTVLDHDSAFKIELVRRQYSGNAHGVIKGIGVVTCVYINPDLGQFWVIDYRIYNPDDDGKSKLVHVREMLDNALHDKGLPVRGVLMDTWYAERKLMLHIERLHKFYYCPLKANRQVAVSADEHGYQRLDSLTWSASEAQQGKLVHLKAFPKGHQVKLFRLVLSTKHTDYLATNEVAQNSTHATQQVGALRWKIEHFHREAKQTTGLEGCPCRLARIQRNHIGCALLVWVRLKQVAHQLAVSIYQLKQGLLHDFMCQQLRSPAIRMSFA